MPRLHDACGPMLVAVVALHAACTKPHGTLAVAERAGAARHASSAERVPGGRIRFSIADDVTGRSLPGRLIVRGVDGTLDPLLGPPSVAAGAATLVVAAAGSGEFAVPPGHYLVTFSHGPEWSIDRQHAEVTADAGARLSSALHHVIPMDDWTACDFHVHSAGSFDSLVSVPDRVASLVAEGVEFAVPTEHNVVGDYAAGVSALPAAASSQQGGPGLAWVPAVEITTDIVGNPVGHFNAYPYRPDASPEHAGPPPANVAPGEIFRAVRERDPTSIIQVNHPRMGNLGYFDLMHLDTATNRAASPSYDPNYDVIEVYNGFYLGDPSQVDLVLHDWLSLLHSGARYVGTANSDSHVIAYNQAGYPRTYVYTPGAGDRAPESDVVLRSLRGGHAFGTSGPMLFARADDALPGDTLQTQRSEVTVHVRVLAAPWVDVDRVDVFRDGEIVVTVPVVGVRNTLRLEQALTLPVPNGRSFIVVVAHGEEPLDVVLPQLNARPMAFTNPIWIDRRP